MWGIGGNPLGGPPCNFYVNLAVLGNLGLHILKGNDAIAVHF
jgi:hypothetical protein